ncbi:hypothetical protein COBT_002635, partial [Conglomerata obtusa]
MNKSQDIVKKVNKQIEQILEELYEIFERLKVTDNSTTNEFADMIIIKRRFNEVMKIILTIYNDIVKLKYIYLQQHKETSQVSDDNVEQTF